MCSKLFKGKDYVRKYSTQLLQGCKTPSRPAEFKTSQPCPDVTFIPNTSVLTLHPPNYKQESQKQNNIRAAFFFSKLLLREKIKRWNINNPLHHLDHLHQPHLPILQIMDLHLHLFVSQSAINIPLKLIFIFYHDFWF